MKGVGGFIDYFARRCLRPRPIHPVYERPAVAQAVRTAAETGAEQAVDEVTALLDRLGEGELAEAVRSIGPEIVEDLDLTVEPKAAPQALEGGEG